MVYSAKIRYTDDGTEMDVLISEFNDTENLPDGLTDENIFFYGMSYENAKRALLAKELCEGEWFILALDDDRITTVGEVRPCMFDGEDVTSGSTVPKDKAQFWGVYRNNPDGTQQHVLDAVTREEAEHVLTIMENFETSRKNQGQLGV